MMRMKRALYLFFSLAVAFSLSTPDSVQAFAYGLSEMGLSHLSFSSSDPNATLDWTNLWYGTVVAAAQDTDTGSSGDFEDLLGNNGNIDALANTLHVHSTANYSVTDGDQVAIDPNAQIAGFTRSYIELKGVGQGDGDARANFDNFFKITGGTPGDQVVVDFFLDCNGHLYGRADAFGYFSIAPAALFSLEDLEGNLLAGDSIEETHSGTNTEFSQSYAETLRLTALLSYDTEYWLYAEADSEVYADNIPEPGTILFIISGLPFVVKKYGRRKRV